MVAFPNPSGRLIHLSRQSGELTVLADNLWFANGVVLSPLEDFIVVAETFASKLTKVHLSGAKKGKVEVFVDGLPGSPDNLSSDADGIWFPLAVSEDDEHPSLAHQLSNFPTARKILVRLLHLIKMPFDVVNKFYPNTITKSVAQTIGSMDSFSFLFPPRRTVVRVNWNGDIVASYHGFDKSTSVTTHVLQVDGYLYLGSVTHDYVGRVKA